MNNKNKAKQPEGDSKGRCIPLTSRFKMIITKSVTFRALQQHIVFLVYHAPVLLGKIIVKYKALLGLEQEAGVKYSGVYQIRSICHVPFIRY